MPVRDRERPCGSWFRLVVGGGGGWGGGVTMPDGFHSTDVGARSSLVNWKTDAKKNNSASAVREFTCGHWQLRLELCLAAIGD